MRWSSGPRLPGLSEVEPARAVTKRHPQSPRGRARLELGQWAAGGGRPCVLGLGVQLPSCFRSAPHNPLSSAGGAHSEEPGALTRTSVVARVAGTLGGHMGNGLQGEPISSSAGWPAAQLT